MRRLLLAAALLPLAACGAGGEGGGAGPSGADSRVLGAVSRLGSLVSPGSRDPLAAVPAAAPGGFTEAEIAADPSAYRLVQINALGVMEMGRVIQRNGEEITLQLQSGPSAAFDGGILTATRGFGDDLLAMDAPNLRQILRAGGGSLTRTTEVLDSQDQVVTSRFACTVSAAGTESVNLGVREVSLRRLDENCRGERLVFDNIYWLDQAGEIVASRQYVSPTVAYLRANRL